MSSNNTISDNNIISNNGDAFYIDESPNNTISNNNISENDDNGISLRSSENNTITGNTISSNTGYGIDISESPNCTLTNNNFSNDGIMINGDMLSHYDTHIMPLNNLVNGKSMHYIKNTEDIIYDGTSLGQLILVNCSGSEAKNLHIVDTDVGIIVAYSPDNLIADNTINNTKDGIMVGHSQNITIIGNNITSNNGYGLISSYSNKSLIYDNIVLNAEYGIGLAYSNDSMVTNNYVINSSWFNVYLGYSSGNIVANNTVAFGMGGIIFEESSNCTVKNNTVTDSYGGLTVGGSSKNITVEQNVISLCKAGIMFDEVSDHHILDNTVTHNDAGIFIDSASYINITGNTISMNKLEGIMLGSASYINISDNVATFNNDAGISLTSSSNINITNNQVSSNDYGIRLFQSSTYNNVMYNAVSDNYEGISFGLSSNYNYVKNNTISSNQGTGIYIFSSNEHNTIVNNTVSNNDDGILIWQSSDYNNISGNFIYSNEFDGINIMDSYNNYIIDNIISENNDDGIEIISSSYNRIYHNDFIENTNQAFDYPHESLWNDTYPSGGNYWSDYSPSAPDLYNGSVTPQINGSSDGICDIQYDFDEEASDFYPLKTPLRAISLPDATPPEDITDLTVTDTTVDSATLQWTSPGDDDDTGTASGYEVRYSEEGPITDSMDWASATEYTQAWVPLDAGLLEIHTITGLDPDTTYWFAIKAYDEIPNYSGISNSPSGTTNIILDSTPPAHIDDLAVDDVTETSVSLTWTAVADNGTDPLSGNASYYDIRYIVDNPVTDLNWISATQAVGEPVPGASGSPESYEVQGLISGITYYFAVITGDEVPNLSPISNTPFATTLTGDSTPPEIEEVSADPSVQEVGDSVNITVTVTDNVKVDAVYLVLKDPDGLIIGNYSMAWDSINSKFYHSFVYSLPGTYTFIIWTKDTSNNWNSTHSAPSEFEIQDTEEPAIIHWADPQTQEIGENINITTLVMDNVNADEVWIEILDWNDTQIENVTMNPMDFAGSYWYENTYSETGIYKYIIWARDSSGNQAFSEGSFTIRDTTSPVANAGSDQEVFQGEVVTFDGTGSSDDDTIANYTWTINYGGEKITLFGISPTYKFETIGNYAINLRVKDPSGNSAEDVLLIKVTGVDSDSDGLTDYDEENVYGTNPDEADTDGDDVNDGDEIALGTDPLEPGKPKKSEDSILKDLWWLYLIIAIVMMILLLLLLFRKKKETIKEETIEEKQLEPEITEESEDIASVPSPPPEISEESPPPPPEQ
jgi:parallel beta-helix repeat protein